MSNSYRELTDYIKERLGDMNYGIIGRNVQNIFTHEHIKTCVNLFPKQKLPHMSPTQKSRYLLALCKSKASGADYKRTQRKLFDETDFSL